MSQTPALEIQLVRIPDQFDGRAQQQLGAIASLVQTSRQDVWGTTLLSDDAQDIFRNLKDPYERISILCAYLGDRLVGRAEVRLPLIAFTEAAQVSVHVDPTQTSEGVGQALLAAAEQYAYAESRKIIRLVTEHPAMQSAVGAGNGSVTDTSIAGDDHDVPWVSATDGSGAVPGSHRQTRFAQNAGYELQTVSNFAFLQVPQALGRVPQLKESLQDAPGMNAYTVHTWAGSAPEELLEPLAALHARLPSDSFVQPIVADPDPWDAQRVRRTEQLRQEDGDQSLMAVIQDHATGELAGLTELILAAERPTIALQDETVVVREHRGRRLGMRLKIANLEQLARVAPQVHTVYSWTHTGNHRMNWVNAQLGFEDAGQSAMWMRDFRTT